MALIDCHFHVGTKQHWHPWVMSFFAKENPHYTSEFADFISPEALLSYLNKQEIDKVIVLSEYAPQTTGVFSNEQNYLFCKNHRDRFIPFGSVSLDSHLDTGSQTLFCVRDLGFAGLKLMPSYIGRSPCDKIFLPAYETAAQLKIPIMFHTGSSVFKGSRVIFADPLLLDDIAEDFPDLTIIMAHGGRPFWYPQAEWMLMRHKNTYIDISGIPARRLPEAFPNLEKLKERFIFGSDWPGIESVQNQVVKIRALGYSQKTLELLFSENILRILNRSK